MSNLSEMELGMLFHHSMSLPFLFILALIKKTEESIFHSFNFLSWGMILLVLIMLKLVNLSGAKGKLMHFLFVMLVFTFSTKNFLLFFVFLEGCVIPTFFLILGWGASEGREEASKFFLMYTLVFSIPFFLFIIFNNWVGSSLLVDQVGKNEIHWGWSLPITMVFLSKMPIFFLHLWLPKAHVQAPLQGSMLLAAILLKLGTYGFFRSMISFFSSVKFILPFCFSIGILGSLISSMICFAQSDLKRLVAYSSVAHMGILLGGLSCLSFWGIFGGMTMMAAHAFSSSGLFCAITFFYQRSFSRSNLILKGGVSFLSSLFFFIFLLCAISISLPPTLSFFSELFCIWGILSFNLETWMIMTMIILISCGYTMQMLSIFHGPEHLQTSGEEMTTMEMNLMGFHLIPAFLLFIIYSKQF